ncbi:MAG: TolC family protein [Acidobacteria bacterium]|nr:TolC family protein [Acidobacteriota bacterium]
MLNPRLIAAAGLAASLLKAQIQDFTTPESPAFGTANYFRKTFAIPTPRVELSPPVRLSDFVVDGKIELSLRSYLELVMANNTDIQIQRMLIEPTRNAITRAFAPFDPFVQAQFRDTRTNTPATDLLAGADTVKQLQQPLQVNFQQRLMTGTTYTVGFNGSKTSTNSTFANFNPAINTNLNFTITQPLLRDRGQAINKLPIMVARSRLRSVEYNMLDQLIRLLTQAENAYWDVIGSRENLKVQEQALALADESLKRARRELDLGALSALEIYQPQAQYARAEIFVTQARYRLAQAEDALRRQIAIDLDSDLRRLPVVLTEPVLPPTDSRPIDRELTVESAYRARPDLKAIIQNLDVDDLQIRNAVNGLKPDLSLALQYTSQGRGGPFYQRTNVFDPTGARSTITRVLPGGLGDAFDQLGSFNFPVYGFTLTLRLPLKDRAAAANYADAVVNKRLDSLRARNVEQTIRLDVLNAVSQVENSRASVDLAKIAAELAQKRVEADQKRYELGTITLFFLLDSQTALTQAQSDLVNQSVLYRRNLLTLLQRTGTLLEERGIVVQ